MGWEVLVLIRISCFRFFGFSRFFLLIEILFSSFFFVI